MASSMRRDFFSSSVAKPPACNLGEGFRFPPAAWMSILWKVSGLARKKFDKRLSPEPGMYSQGGGHGMAMHVG